MVCNGNNEFHELHKYLSRLLSCDAASDEAFEEEPINKQHGQRDQYIFEYRCGTPFVGNGIGNYRFSAADDNHFGLALHCGEGPAVLKYSITVPVFVGV